MLCRDSPTGRGTKFSNSPPLNNANLQSLLSTARVSTIKLPITTYQLLPLSPQSIPLIPPLLAPLMLFMDLLHVIGFLLNGGFEP